MARGPDAKTDAKIDQLYQLPLDEFTAARNALAKEAGADAARVRALTKPPIAAWAVNQLHWRDADTWNALIEASENARRAHKAVLSGRGGDVRAASSVHEEAAEAALKKTLAILADAGHPVTDATRQAIATTIRALPGDEAPGRLTKVLQPGGFEMLAGLSVAAGARVAQPAAKVAPAKSRAEVTTHPSSSSSSASSLAKSKVDAKALTRARQVAAEAANALRDAERAVQREEFEVARTTRDAERAARAIEEARDALERARTDLQTAEKAAKVTERERDEAQKRADAARKHVERAREKAAAAAGEVERL